MDYTLEIWNLIITGLDFKLILMTLAIGEVLKPVIKFNISSFYKVIITTLPLSLAYSIIANIKPQIALLSYVVAFWLYPLFVKYIFKRISKFKKEVGGEFPPDDDE